jgi:hypothetical protein
LIEGDCNGFVKFFSEKYRMCGKLSHREAFAFVFNLIAVKYLYEHKGFLFYIFSRVEDGRGDRPKKKPRLRFPSPLIEPDVRISRIRLSDKIHRQAHGRAPKCTRRR